METGLVIRQAKDFCENIVLDDFYNDKGDAFPRFRIVVTAEGNENCMEGIPDQEIEADVGFCLPEANPNLVPKGTNFDPIVFIPKGDAPGIGLGVASTLLMSVCLAMWM